MLVRVDAPGSSMNAPRYVANGAMAAVKPESGVDAIAFKPLPAGTMLLAHRVSDIVRTQAVSGPIVKWI